MRQRHKERVGVIRMERMGRGEEQGREEKIAR